MFRNNPGACIPAYEVQCPPQPICPPLQHLVELNEGSDYGSGGSGYGSGGSGSGDYEDVCCPIYECGKFKINIVLFFVHESVC